MRLLRAIGTLIVAVLAIVGLVILVLPLFNKGIEAAVLKERWALRWQALDVTNQSLDLAGDGGWTALAGINDAAIEAAYATIKGAKLEHEGDSVLDGTTLTIEDVRISPGMGAMDAAIALTAEKGDLTLGLVVEGVILVSAIENGTKTVVLDNEEKREVRASKISLRIDPVAIDLGVARADLDRRHRGFWNDLVPGLANVILPDELLTMTVPLQAEFIQAIGLDEEKETVLDETTNASVTYHLSMPENEVSVGLAYGAPVYTENAVWVMAREVTHAPPDIRARALPSQDAAELERLALALYEQIKSRFSPEQRLLEGIETPRLAVAIDSRLLDAIRSKILEIPAEKRQVSAQLKNSSGKLAEDTWRDDILGDGGVYVEIGCPDCGSLDVDLHDVSFDTTGEAWKASIVLSASASGGLHAHFDPLIGGGTGTKVGVEGRTGGVQSIGASIRPQILTDTAGHRIAALQIQPSCERMEIIATTDGKLKLDVGWMSMPRVGARMFVPVSTKAIDPVQVIVPDTITHFWADRKKLQKDDDSGIWWLTVPHIASVISLAPAEFSLSDGMMRSALDFDIRQIPAPEDPEARAALRKELEAKAKASRKQAIEATRAMLEEARKESLCEDVPIGMRLLLGDAEFGPNNEIIKFLRKSWNDITKGLGPNNEIVKLLDGAGETFHRSAAVASGLVEGILDDTGNVLAYGTDAVKAYNEEATRVRKAAEEAAKKLADEAEKKLAEETERKRKEAEKTAKKVEEARQAAAQAAVDLLNRLSPF